VIGNLGLEVPDRPTEQGGVPDAVSLLRAGMGTPEPRIGEQPPDQRILTNGSHVYPIFYTSM
jgi:hypothetical protein